MSVLLALRNLLHEKSKLVLSVSGVASALTLIAILIGFRDGMYASLTAYVDNIGADLIVAQSGVKGLFSSNSALPVTLHDELVSVSKAEVLGHILIADLIFTHGDNKTPVLMVGFNPETGTGGPWNLSEGRAAIKDDEIVLDGWLARRGEININDKVTVLGQDFTVVGLARETSSWMSSYIFVTHTAAEEALQLSGITSFYLLRLPQGTDVKAVASSIDEQIAGVETLAPSEIAAADRKILAAVMDTPISVILVISFIIGIAVMGLTAYTAIIDRMQEYGVLMAIGAGQVQLSRIVIFETFYRALLGFILGIGLSYLVAELIMYLWPQFMILIRPITLLGAGLAALVMTIFAALLPIRRVAAIEPAVVFKG